MTLVNSGLKGLNTSYIDLLNTWTPVILNTDLCKFNSCPFELSSTISRGILAPILNRRFDEKKHVSLPRTVFRYI